MSDGMVTVGIAEGEFRGADNRAVQAAIDAMAGSGGGIVRVLPGTYVLDDSVHLRDNVTLIGSGAETILRKGPEVYSKLSEDLGYGHYDVSIAEPDKFRVGMGVTIRDERAVGFYETIATLLWRDGERFGVDHMLNHDYARGCGGEIYTSFAPISAKFVSNVEVRDLVVEGNKDDNPHVLNACRGAGVYLLAARHARVANVVVRDLNGDAIGFQQCTHVAVEDCLMENNTGHGLHPGSGSAGAVMRGCRCIGNGRDGVFFCLRATYSICEECEFIGNGNRGVSIGDRDTNNAIVRCTVSGNLAAGMALRETDQVMAAHTTLVAENAVADNCVESEDAEIAVLAPARDVHILNNRIEHRGGPRPVFAIKTCPDVRNVHVHANRCTGEFKEEIRVEGDGGGVLLSPPATPLPVGPGAAPDHADWHLPPNVRG
ncbi:MAG: right-handed parallel beta-helix repeat-containing protein [Armatimonadota bacterium]|nr:MAG: right-handed parallel beta-helix repeat-containing protein [Armatimonadota bacterium]